MPKKLDANTKFVAMDGNEVVMEFRSRTEADRWSEKAGRAGFGADIRPVLHGAIVKMPEVDEPPYSAYSRNPLYDIMAEDDDDEEVE